MKKMLLLSFLFSFLGFAIHAQIEKPFPIPSYKIAVDSGYAQFREDFHRNKPDASRQKRDMHVKITSNNPIILQCQAQVLVYSLDGLDILGPYTVLCGGMLVVEIDERQWGVLVQTNASILTDVWIE